MGMNKQRERATGQYAHALDRQCVCGHTKGAHIAGGIAASAALLYLSSGMVVLLCKTC